MTGEQLLRTEQELNGYRLEEILGRDIDSRLIFKSVNYKKQRRVIKFIDIRDGNLEATLNQAIFYCQIDHPHITKTYDFMIRNKNRQLAIFMEYCGNSLADSQILKNLTDQQIDNYAKIIVQALFYIHEYLKISHCDIRMESIQLFSSKEGTHPKISFYNVTTGDSVPTQCYAPCDFSRDHEKQSDVWCLGLLLLQLYSRRRIPDILLSLKQRWRPCYKAQGFNNLSLFRFIKSSPVKALLKDILQRHARHRPKIKDIFEKLCGSLCAKRAALNYQTSTNSNNNEYNYEQTNLVTNIQRHKSSNHLKNNPIASIPSKMKYQKRITQRQINSSMNSDIFRLTNIKDRSKVKILNLSNMKISRIQQIYGIPLLQWLYLQNNMIQVIQNIDYPSLVGLNLGSNRICKIQGLDSLHNLTQLYLQNNEITHIQNLQNNRKIKSIYLNDNKIRQIQNIGYLPQLTLLALKNNKIDRYQQLNSKAITNLQLLGVQVFI